MEHPFRVAFCKVFFAKNGGTFTEYGLPIFSAADHSEEYPARGYCDKAFDCGSCAYLQEWLWSLYDKGWEIGWECDQCLRDTIRQDFYDKTERKVEGFFQSGRPKLPVDHPDYWHEHDEDSGGLEGCTRCGWGSSFLQLVLRKRAAVLP